MAEPKTPARAGRRARPDLDTEVANRLRDPFEVDYLGVLRTNDPLLLERGAGSVAIYRDLKRDPKVFDGLQKRCLALVGYEWTVTPVDESTGAEAAQHATRALKQCGFDQVCKDLMEALLVGFAVCEVVWTVRDGWVVPARLIKRNPRRFVYVQEDADLPPALRLLTRNSMITGELLPDRKFVVHRVNAEDDNPYGNGLGLQSYWPVFFKRKGVVSWNKLNDRFGSPTPWGRYPRSAGPKEKATLFDALRAMSNDGVLMTPEGMDVQLLESKLTGSVSTQHALCDYMDEWLDAVWLGKEGRAKSGGAQAAAAKERSDVRLALTKADADLLSDTLNSTLMAWMCEFNGWPACQVHRQVKEEVDLKAMADADAVVAGMGFELDEATVRTRYGEGWSRKAPPPAPPPGRPGPQGLSSGLSPTAFAEAAFQGLQDPVVTEVNALVRAAAPAWGAVVDQLQALVDQAESLEALGAALTTAYGGLDSGDLVKLMAAAFALAELKGLDGVRREVAAQ